MERIYIIKFRVWGVNYEHLRIYIYNSTDTYIQHQGTQLDNNLNLKKLSSDAIQNKLASEPGLGSGQAANRDINIRPTRFFINSTT